MALTSTDTEVRQNVLDALLHDSRLDESHIAVTVTNGVVSLSGSVPDYFQKTIAEQDARRIKGVVDVVNRLVVSPPEAYKDERIHAAVLAKIDRDVRIAHPEWINVLVHDGVVTLTGTVSTYTQKLAANDAAWTVPGVVDVVNETVVLPTVTRSDAEIDADVRHALAADADINAVNVRVTVKNSIVCLRGSVPAYYQIGKAAHDAWCVPGVANVENDLTVVV